MNLTGFNAALAVSLVIALPAQAAPGQEATEQLARAAQGNVQIKRHAGTGNASFARLRGRGDLMPAAGPAEDKATAFMARHGEAFGVPNAKRDLRQLRSKQDALGQRTTTFAQTYNGVPVFGARINTAVNAAGQLTAVSGSGVGTIDVDVIARIGAADARKRASAYIRQWASPRHLGALDTSAATLYIYNKGFVRGRKGNNELVYEVQVSGADVRENVYVNAHSGKIADRITATYDAIQRRIYEGGFSAATQVWAEGDAAPTGNTEWDNLIDYSFDIYNLIGSISGGSYLSWDGSDGIMHAANNHPAVTCPNAQFTGSYIRFCPGTTTDDVVAHEWAHGYTQETHGLIYLYQSGAMNEAYSDIFGEIVDLLNGDGNDFPNANRNDGACSVFGASGQPSLDVSAPAAVAGNYSVGGAQYNPTAVSPVTAEAIGTSPADGCSTISTNLNGKIALIDRGSCNFSVKTGNAQNAGAVGVVVINNQGDGIQSMGGTGTFLIPSVFIGQTNGANVKAQGNVTATISLPSSTDNSYRWLTGEDSTSFGGAIRDMWNPTCYGDPGKVSDVLYACDPTLADNGGVHSNSGIINHGFALLVDGGTYNGQSIAPLGLTKAAHLYWRTMAVYQTPVSGYADHAAALQAACSDLTGANLSSLSVDLPISGDSGDVISAADCQQVDKVIAAIELNQQPTQCNFQTLLAQSPPALCADGETAVNALEQGFEAGLGSWSVGRRAIVNQATFDIPDWSIATGLPHGRTGQAAFGADPVLGDCSSDIEAGVTYLQSPAFDVPAGGRLVFDHSLTTEGDWDGGNIKVSVNGGAYQLLPASAFIYNAYNGTTNASDNPLGGEPAFHGGDEGTLVSLWGQSQVDLTAVAAVGSTVRLRFEMGTDGCNGVHGWYVDDVRAYSCAVSAPDSDSDGVSDDVDNCTLVANADQRDTNGDGFGNRCDADLNNDNIVNASDLGLFRSVFFSSDADADFNGDGVVNASDLGILRTLFFAPPGPSGIAP